MKYEAHFGVAKGRKSVVECYGDYILCDLFFFLGGGNFNIYGEG